MKTWVLGGVLLASLAQGVSAAPLCCFAEPDAAPPPAASPSPSESPGDEPLGTSTGGRLKIGSEGFGLGSRTPDPTALESYIRQDVVLFDSNRLTNVAVTAGYLHRFSEADQMLVEIEGDQATGVADLSFSHYPADWPGRLTVQAFGTTAKSPMYADGSIPTPFVRRLGGGVEWSQKATDDLTLASALNYQQVGIADKLLGGRTVPVDALGNPLSLEPGGLDHITALRVVGLYEGQDDSNFPTEGTKLRFELQPGVTTGAFLRAAFNWAQLFPVGEDTGVLFNLQAGSMMGTFIPYQAFNLGGANSVRGYATGGLGTARSFVQSTLELRQLLTDFEVLGVDFRLRGILFADYATDLGTAGSVPGQPALVRDRPLRGAGYGLGLHFLSDYGLFRLEAGWGSSGENAVYFTVGERF